MKQLHFAAIAIATLLAGCGGGGGGSSPIPTVSNAPHSAQLAAGFAKTGGTTAASRTHRVIANAVRMMTDPVLGGQIVPFAIFAVPDSYVPANAPAKFEYDAVAYLDTSNGGTLPNPLPTPLFRETGNPLPVVGTNVGSGQIAGLPKTATIIGSERVAVPSSTGQTTVDVTALSQTINLTANSYQGASLSATSNATGSPTGLTFGTTGGSPTSSGTADLAIDTTTTPSAFVAPGGIMEVGKEIDLINASDFVVANAVTRLPVSDICTIGSGYHSFLFKTQTGLLVKFEIDDIYGTDLGPACAWTDVFGPYMVAGASGFAY